MNHYLALTVVNAALLIVWFAFLRYQRIQWRVVLAMLPTPMLGFASSYGVYAFNAYFVPPWVAIAMAAAYELTYVGLASYTTLNIEQQDIGLSISRAAAWISFAQNGLAGLVHIQPSILSYQTWGAYSLLVNVPLAALHAAQVWIAYRTANFTLHGVRIEQKTVNVDSFAVDDLSIMQVDTAQPKALPLVDEADHLELPSTIDKRAIEWAMLHDNDYTYGAISDMLGGAPSRQYIGEHVKRYRAWQPTQVDAD